MGGWYCGRYDVYLLILIGVLKYARRSQGRAEPAPLQVRHLPWYENSKWLLPDVEYARKHRGKGHTFGWWSHAEGYARRGKQIIDSEPPPVMVERTMS